MSTAIAPVQPDTEKRGQAMWIDRIAGRSNEDIALRHGVCQSEVDDLIQQAIQNSLMKKQNIVVQTQAVDLLSKNVQALLEMDAKLPLWGVRWHQELDRAGNKKLLRELACNANTKKGLRAELRQTTLAMKAMIGLDQGVVPDDSRKDEIAAVVGVVKSVAMKALEDLRNEAFANGVNTAKLDNNVKP